MSTDKPQANVIQGIQLENFTAFDKLDLSNFGRLNAIIGLNDTGKTQLLKALYSGVKITDKILAELNELEEKPYRFINTSAYLCAEWCYLFGVGYLTIPPHMSFKFRCFSKSLLEFRAKIENEPFTACQLDEILNKKINRINSVFIPAKESLGLHSAILETRDSIKKRLDVFDNSYYDLAKIMALTPDDARPYLANDIINLLRPLIKTTTKDLRVTVEGAGVVFKKGSIPLPVSQAPEGPKKALILQQLFKKQIIDLDEPTVLFIDEPEANLHADAVVKFAEVLHKLANMGVQIFLATHSYFLMKRLEQLAKEDELNQTACNNTIIDLHRNDDTDIIEATMSRFTDGLPANSRMLQQFEALFNTDMALAYRAEQNR